MVAGGAAMKSPNNEIDVAGAGDVESVIGRACAAFVSVVKSDELPVALSAGQSPLQ